MSPVRGNQKGIEIESLPPPEVARAFAEAIDRFKAAGYRIGMDHCPPARWRLPR
jgi:hypothetical protein